MSETETPSALSVMADRMNLEPAKLHQTLKSTCFKGANDEEMMTLVVVANEHKLNPLQKEIYAFPAKGGGIVPVISIDGWIKIMNQHPSMNGVSFSFQVDDEKKPFSCACTIWVKGRENPVVITEFYEECKRNTEPWRQYPFRMLRHKALSQGVRVAFGFAGYADDSIDAEVAEDEAPDLKPIFGEIEPGQKLELFGDDSPPGAEMKTDPQTVGAE
jgi:phage recombination protein Bet